jgi:hypothetical protein
VRHFRVDPPQRVLATIDGTVRPATLTHWKQDDQGRWTGYVSWSEAPGLTHLDWLPAEALKVVED